MKTDTTDALFGALVEAKRREKRAQRANVVSWVVLGILCAALVAAICALIAAKRDEAKELSRLERTSADLAFISGGRL